MARDLGPCREAVSAGLGALRTRRRIAAGDIPVRDVLGPLGARPEPLLMAEEGIPEPPGRSAGRRPGRLRPVAAGLRWLLPFRDPPVGGETAPR